MPADAKRPNRIIILFISFSCRFIFGMAALEIVIVAGELTVNAVDAEISDPAKHTHSFFTSKKALLSTLKY